MQQFEIDNQFKMLENQQNIVNALKDLVVVIGLTAHVISSPSCEDSINQIDAIVRRNMK